MGLHSSSCVHVFEVEIFYYSFQLWLRTQLSVHLGDSPVS